MRRREFLKVGLATVGAVALGPSFWERVYTAAAQPGTGPYGPLQEADGNGLMLPAGFTSRVVARSGLPVPGTLYPWPIFPDGAHCFATSDGGWIQVVNSETPSADIGAIPDEIQRFGGASAIRYSPAGAIEDAYNVLGDTRTNCAGGATPWGTWLSCEEFDDSIRGGPTARAGKVWECDPTGAAPPIRRDALGSFKHEAAAVDPATNQVYLTEDVGDGRFYRFTPATFTGEPDDLNTGTLEAAERIGPEPNGPWTVAWHMIDDPSAAAVSTRYQAASSSPFDGGEGCFFDSGIVYVTTKGDNRVWRYNVDTQELDLLYDASLHTDPVLTGVDNLIVSQTGKVYVAEDGGNMEVVVITPGNEVAPIVRATGPQHGFDSPSPFPTVSEITGLAISPDGTRMYFNSQRAYVLGVTYEITFRSGSAA